MKRSRPVLMVLFAALVAGAAALAWQAADESGRGKRAPTVSYTLLDGSKHDSADQRGKVVLVNFWATSCTTCVAEMPQLVATHAQFQARGFDTVAVAMRYDAPANVVRFAASRQLPFGVAIDNTGEIAKRFGEVELTPTTFLIDKRGHIAKRWVGTPDFAALRLLIERLLAEA